MAADKCFRMDILEQKDGGQKLPCFRKMWNIIFWYAEWAKKTHKWNLEKDIRICIIHVSRDTFQRF